MLFILFKIIYGYQKIFFNLHYGYAMAWLTHIGKYRELSVSVYIKTSNLF